MIEHTKKNLTIFYNICAFNAIGGEAAKTKSQLVPRHIHMRKVIFLIEQQYKFNVN